MRVKPKKEEKKDCFAALPDVRTPVSVDAVPPAEHAAAPGTNK
jgi:hypothetical protein